MPNTAIDPTQQLSGVQRALYSYLDGLTIPGAPHLVYDGMQRPEKAVPWAWVEVKPLAGTRVGRATNGSQGATHERVLLVVSLFWRDGSLEGGGSVYALADAASELKHRLSPPLALNIQDWTNPASPQATDIDLFPLDVAEIVPVADSGGFRRARVQQTFTYFSRSTLS